MLLSSDSRIVSALPARIQTESRGNAVDSTCGRSCCLRPSGRAKFRSVGKSSSNLRRGLSGVAQVVIIFQQTREFIPIEPSPVSPQTGEKFEFVACENRHINSCCRATKRVGIAAIKASVTERFSTPCACPAGASTHFPWKVSHDSTSG